eukprot:4605370-Prorocentrum_lima.AAC.1
MSAMLAREREDTQRKLEAAEASRTAYEKRLKEQDQQLQVSAGKGDSVSDGAVDCSANRSRFVLRLCRRRRAVFIRPRASSNICARG